MLFVPRLKFFERCYLHLRVHYPCTQLTIAFMQELNSARTMVDKLLEQHSTETDPLQDMIAWNLDAFLVSYMRNPVLRRNPWPEVPIVFLQINGYFFSGEVTPSCPPELQDFVVRCRRAIGIAKLGQQMCARKLDPEPALHDSEGDWKHCCDNPEYDCFSLHSAVHIAFVLHGAIALMDSAIASFPRGMCMPGKFSITSTNNNKNKDTLVLILF